MLPRFSRRRRDVWPGRLTRRLGNVTACHYYHGVVLDRHSVRPPEIQEERPANWSDVVREGHGSLAALF
jgi:hypothetical protein